MKIEMTENLKYLLKIKNELESGDDDNELYADDQPDKCSQLAFLETFCHKIETVETFLYLIFVIISIFIFLILICVCMKHTSSVLLNCAKIIQTVRPKLSSSGNKWRKNEVLSPII